MLVYSVPNRPRLGTTSCLNVVIAVQTRLNPINTLVPFTTIRTLYHVIGQSFMFQVLGARLRTRSKVSPVKPASVTIQMNFNLLTSPYHSSTKYRSHNIVTYSHHLQIHRMRARGQMSKGFTLIFSSRSPSHQLSTLQFILRLIIPPRGLRSITSLNLIFK